MKVLPYVYKGVHKASNQFYIGYRCANKVPAVDDLGKKYHTSSKYVKALGSENFDWTIIAEFTDKFQALEYEQQLIDEHIKDPLCLNKYSNRKRFTMAGGVVSESTRQKIGNANKGRVMTAEAKRKQAQTRKGYKHSPDTLLKLSLAKKGRPGHTRTEETKEKMSKAKKGKPGHVITDEIRQKISATKKGRPNHPQTEETKQKISATKKAKNKNNS